MASLAEIQQPIVGNIRHYEAFIASILQSDNAFVSSICQYILAHRGKQLRPLFVLLSAALHGEIDERTYTGAAVVEMIHTASLIHDDVVDEAFVRRGTPSVNALWHSRTAVLVGDYIFARTYHACLREGAWDMLAEVTRAIHEVSEGELIQTEQSETLSITRPIYLDIIYKKTGSLIGACGAVGALSVHAEPRRSIACGPSAITWASLFRSKTIFWTFRRWKRPASLRRRSRSVRSPCRCCMCWRTALRQIGIGGSIS